MKREAPSALLIFLVLSCMFSSLGVQTGIGAGGTDPLGTNAASGSPGNQLWNKTYGGPIQDWANSVIQTSDGGYALAGYTGYSDLVGSGEGYLIKTDSSGNLQWNKTYGGTNYDEFESVVQNSDGGYAIAGRTLSFGASYSNFWLVRTDSTGNILWNKTYGGNNNDGASSMVRTSDGGYALTGYTASYGAGIFDFYLVRTDASGNLLWSKTYGGTGEDQAESVVQTSDGGYALAGFTNSYGAGNWDFYLVKTDSFGNLLWNKTYGGIGWDWAESVVQTSDGGYALAGFTNSYGAGNWDFYLVRTDASGNLLWSKTYGGTGEDRAESVVQTSDGGYALAGFTNSYGAGNGDFWLVRTDSAGNMLWNKTYGGGSSDWAFSIVQTLDGGYALAGYTLTYANSSDFWLVKVSAEAATLTVEPSYGPGGKIIAIIGQQFTSSSLIDIAYYDPIRTMWYLLAAFVPTDSFGNFTFSTPAPDLMQASTGYESGDNVVFKVVYSNSGTWAANATFLEFKRYMNIPPSFSGLIVPIYNDTDLATYFPSLGIVTVGESLSFLSGNYFYPGTVEIQWDGIPIGTTTANSNGFFTPNVLVPQTTVGNHSVAFIDANTIFRVFVTVPAFKLTPSSGPPGASITLKGLGYTSFATVNLAYTTPILPNGSQLVKQIGTIQADSSGRFTYVMSAPDIRPLLLFESGILWETTSLIQFSAFDSFTHVLYNSTFAEGHTGLKQVGTVTSYSHPMTSQWGIFGNGTDLTSSVQMQAGQSMRLIGKWFYPGNINIKWDSVAVGTTVADTTGFFDTSIIVPQTGIGTHRIVISDANCDFHCLVSVVVTLFSGTVHIMTDGSVDPSNSPISRNNNIYTLSASMYNSQIIIEKSNMVLDGAGFTITGAGSGNGIDVTSVTGVTIENLHILNFLNGIAYSSGNNIFSNIIENTTISINLNSGNTVHSNELTNNRDGIWVQPNSYGNLISENQITMNTATGIDLLGNSYQNTIFNNSVEQNQIGIELWNNHDNQVYSNLITGNIYGVSAGMNSINNKLYHNNFVSNTYQSYISQPNPTNVWDNGYLSGGNFWSNYNGVDSNNDGIGDTSYSIDANNQDHYPLMNLWVESTTDYQILVNPQFGTISQGSTSTTIININSLNGYNNQVNLVASGQPAGVQITFSPNNQPTTFSSTMSIQVASGAATGTYPITITGTGSDNKVHSTQYSLTITQSKQSSTITCFIDSNPITFSRGITVSGTISPAHQTQVTLFYNRPDGTSLTRTVSASSSGNFADTYYPDAAGAWTIQTLWSGDSDHLGAQSQNIPLTVTKQDTTITTDAIPSSIYLGNSLVVSGELQPAISAPIVLTYTKPDGSKIKRSVTSSSSGAFTDTFAPNAVGNWYVGASWSGDSNHNGVNNLNFPTPFTVKQVTNPSIISIAPSQNNINSGAGITLSGTISPSHAAIVTIIFTKPDHSSLIRTATSSSNGAYSYTFTSDSSGTWLAIASWGGDSDHNGATSSQASFAVIGPPTAPTNLNAKPVHSGVTLTWQAPTSSGSSSIAQYKIYRGNTPSTESLLGTVNANTFSYTDLSFGVYLLHYYYVTAVNADGKESLKSSEVKCASLESVTGVENVVTINDFQVYDNKPFSIQQNFFIPLANYGDFYWVQNVVKVARVEVSTGKYEWQMYGGFEIWKYTNWQTFYLTDKPVWFFITQSANSPLTKTIILQSTIDNGKVTLQNSAHAPWTWSTVLPLNSYILQQDSSPTGWGSPEISLAGAEYAGCVVTFTGNTNGYVDTYTKLDSNNWISGANTVIRNPNKASTAETSNWLFWQQNGDFQCTAAWTDQGLNFRPDFQQPIATPPTLSSFVATLHSPANLYITDKNGLSVGYNLKTNQTECNIPGAFYSGPNTEPQVISIPNSIEGNYNVQVIGTGNGVFSVDFQKTAFNITDMKTVSGSISSGAIYQYNIEYTNESMTVKLDSEVNVTPSPTPTPTPTPTATPAPTTPPSATPTPTSRPLASPTPSPMSTALPSPSPSPTASATPTPEPSSTGFPVEYVFAIVGLVAAVIAALIVLLLRKKK